MLRLTEIRLPIDHAEAALRQAILERLAIEPDALQEFTIFRRGIDARKKNRIFFIYTLDVSTTDDERLLAQHVNHPHIKNATDTHYRFVARAPASLASRPVSSGWALVACWQR